MGASRDSAEESGLADSDVSGMEFEEPFEAPGDDEAAVPDLELVPAG